MRIIALFFFLFEPIPINTSLSWPWEQVRWASERSHPPPSRRCLALRCFAHWLDTSSPPSTQLLSGYAADLAGRRSRCRGTRIRAGCPLLCHLGRAGWTVSWWARSSSSISRGSSLRLLLMTWSRGENRSEAQWRCPLSYRWRRAFRASPSPGWSPRYHHGSGRQCPGALQSQTAFVDFVDPDWILSQDLGSQVRSCLQFCNMSWRCKSWNSYQCRRSFEAHPQRRFDVLGSIWCLSWPGSILQGPDSI